MSRLVGLVFGEAQINGSRRGRISKLEDSRHLETNTAHSVRRKLLALLTRSASRNIEERRMECFTPLLQPPPYTAGQTPASPAPSPPSLGMPLGDGRRGCNGATALHERGVQLKDGHPAC
jgi:hypothetical protein